MYEKIFIAVLTVMILLSVIALVETAEPRSDNYRAAYARSMRSGRPIVALMSMRNCPPCRLVKERLVPRLRTKGEFCVLTYEDNHKLWDKMKKSPAAPHVVVWKWRLVEGKRRWRYEVLYTFSAIKEYTERRKK